MKKNQDFVSMMKGIIFLFYGVILFFNFIPNLKWSIILFFLLFMSLHFMTFFFSKKENEYSNLFLGIIGVFFTLISFFGDFTKNPQIFSIVFLSFALLVSFVKLKKADYFHDRKNKLWLIEMACLILFLISEILFCLQLHHQEEIILIFFGYNVFTISAFELLESLLILTTKGKLK